jgi:hypothetical protein
MKCLKGTPKSPLIIFTYKNGTNWVRISSDGWCEQGANNLSIPGNAANYVVRLILPYRSVNDYNLTLRISDQDGAQDQASEWGCGRKTTTTFEIGINGGYGTTQNFDWSGKGYVNLEDPTVKKFIEDNK